MESTILHEIFTGSTPTGWLVFFGIVAVMLFLDLFVVNKNSHTISLKEAIITSVIWIAVALAFNLGIFFFGGHVKGAEFLTGYLIEKSLSVDNLFVFTMVFAYFKVKPEHQPKILIWGIIGALIFRAIFIVVGVALIEQFSWILYVFGAILVFTGIQMMLQKEDKEIHPEDKIAIKLVKKIFPITTNFEGFRFFVKREHKIYATSLFLVLITIETTDIIFAIDSIPAIFGITQDPYIIYTSNIFALLGLRALYFVLANIIEKFKYLKYGVTLVLIFIGLKMMAESFIHIPTYLSLAIIAFLLSGSVIISLVINKMENNKS